MPRYPLTPLTWRRMPYSARRILLALPDESRTTLANAIHELQQTSLLIGVAVGAALGALIMAYVTTITGVP